MTETITEKNTEQTEQTPPASVPYDRFKDVNEKRKSETTRAETAERNLREMQEKQEAAENKKLEEDGEHEKLAAENEELRPYKSRLQEYEDDQRADILASESLTDEDREAFAELPLKQLRITVKRLESSSTPPQGDDLPGDAKVSKDWQKTYKTKTDLVKQNPALYRQLKKEGKL
jgi:hypothetical protein